MNLYDWIKHIIFKCKQRMRKRNHSGFISWFETEQEVFVRIKLLGTFHEQCHNTIQIISHSINVTTREGQENKACSFYISNEQRVRRSLKIIIKKMQVIALVFNFKPNFQSYDRVATINVKCTKASMNCYHI